MLSQTPTELERLRIISALQTGMLRQAALQGLEVTQEPSSKTVL